MWSGNIRWIHKDSYRIASLNTFLKQAGKKLKEIDETLKEVKGILPSDISYEEIHKPDKRSMLLF